MNTKICSNCGKEKPLSAFYGPYPYYSGDGYSSKCKACVSEYTLQYQKANPEKVYARQKRWVQKNRRRWRCAKCGTPIDRKSTYCVHCHSDRMRWLTSKLLSVCAACGTGQTKGVFCPHCSFLKGHGRDPYQYYMLAATGRKVCLTCNQIKLVSDFYASQDSFDGIASQCKACKDRNDKDICPSCGKLKTRGVELCKSCTQKKLWKNPAFRKRMIQAFKEVSQRPEVRRRRSENAKRMHRKGLLLATEKPNKLETEVFSALKKLNHEFQAFYRPDNCPFEFDAYLPDLGLLLEIDGWRWHHSKWAIRRRIPERDARKEKWAKRHSYRLIRFDENDIQKFGAKALILKEIESSI